MVLAAWPWASPRPFLGHRLLPAPELCNLGLPAPRAPGKASRPSDPCAAVWPWGGAEGLPRDSGPLTPARAAQLGVDEITH